MYVHGVVLSACLYGSDN